MTRVEGRHMCSCKKPPHQGKRRSCWVELRASGPLWSTSQFHLLDVSDTLGNEILFHGIQVVGSNPEVILVTAVGCGGHEGRAGHQAGDQVKGHQREPKVDRGLGGRGWGGSSQIEIFAVETFAWGLYEL